MNDDSQAMTDELNNPANWPRPKKFTRYYNELSRGTHMGVDWYVAHNDIGFRNGYVRMNRHHPWFAKRMGDSDIADIDVHGGITYANKGVPRFTPRFSYQWWLGFDCGHGGDAPDISLIAPEHMEEMRYMEKIMMTDETTPAWFRENFIAQSHNPDETLPGALGTLSRYGEIRTQEYTEDQCRLLAEQVAHAL